MLPSFVLELTKKIAYERKEYNKCTNLPIYSKVAGSNNLNIDKSYNQQS